MGVRLGILAALVAALGPAPALAAAVPPPVLAIRSVPTAAQPQLVPRVTWSTGTGVPGKVVVGTSVRGPATQVGYGSSGDGRLPRVEAKGSYVVSLYTIGLHTRLLAWARVARGHVQVELLSRAWIPPKPSRVVDRILQLVPFALFAVFAYLIGAYLRSLRARPA